jgi:ribosomal-protein-alanine N-acetyltransferase
MMQTLKDFSLETERLRIVPWTLEDSQFILQLLNDPLWISGIGDRGINATEDAEKYLINGPFHYYNKYGYGSYKVMLKESNKPIGMCGLYKRDYLDCFDLGFAFLSEFVSKGYGKEASLAIMNYAKDTLNFSKLLGIVSPSNERSIRLLDSLGFKKEKQEMIDGKETIVYSYQFKTDNVDAEVKEKA